MNAPSKLLSYWRSIDPYLAISICCTVAFYALMLSPAMEKTILHRYTTEHVVDYVIVSLFMWRIVDFTRKILSFPRELVALRRAWLPARRHREPVSHAATLLASVVAQPTWAQESIVGGRLTAALEYVQDNGTAADYHEHLEYLRAQDEDSSHASYTLIRFAIAITPILGFLGTVVHFGTALSGISFDTMAEKLPVVVGEMGQAFNTTTVALAASMSLMFALFFCERIENGIVRSVNRLAERELLTRFEVQTNNVSVSGQGGPVVLHESAIQSIRTCLTRQIEIWSESLNLLFQRLDERQAQQVEMWHKALTETERRHLRLESEAKELLERVLGSFVARHKDVTVSFEHSLERTTTLRDDFQALLDELHRLDASGQRLCDLQTVLTNNLGTLRETQQIDQALHGLTAAIHLMTARQRGFPDAAAA